MTAGAVGGHPPPALQRRTLGGIARQPDRLGGAVSDATCLRVLRDSALVLPVDYVRERRDLA